MRIATEVLPKPPKFIFLENVLGIRSSRLLRVLECLASVRYDVRWCVVSASSVGAHHQRQRWFALCRLRPEEEDVAHPQSFNGGDNAGCSVHQPQHCADFEQVRRLACWSEKDAEVFVREPQVPRVVDGGSRSELDLLPGFLLRGSKRIDLQAVVQGPLGKRRGLIRRSPVCCIEPATGAAVTHDFVQVCVQVLQSVYFRVSMCWHLPSF